MPRITITQTYVDNLKAQVEDCHAEKSYCYYKDLIYGIKDDSQFRLLTRLSDIIFYLDYINVLLDDTTYIPYVKDEAFDNCDIKQELLNSEPLISPILYENGDVILLEQTSTFLELE